MLIAESLSQHDEKHVEPTPLNGIRVGRRRIHIESEFGLRYTSIDASTEV
jgi:hypothetical protein